MNSKEKLVMPPSAIGHPMGLHIGQQFVEAFDDFRTRLKIPFNEAFIGNPVTGAMHLGPITAILDAAAGFSVMRVKSEFSPIVTLDLRIDSLLPANEKHDIIVECKPYLQKGDLYFVDGKAWQSDESKPVLAFHSVFMQAPSRFNADGTPSEAPPLVTGIEIQKNIVEQMEFNKESHPIFDIVPYANDLEMEVGKNEHGERIIKLPFAERHMGNPMTRALQGGIFLGFLECAGSAYLLDIYPELKQCNSASFFMEFLSAPKDVDTFAKVTASKVGRRVVNLDIEAFQLGRNTIAKASGRYLVVNE